jgi:DNA-binding NtrC family response regulator
MAEARILVVDDEYLIRWSLQQNLEKEGFEVLLAETGEEALNKVTEEAPDLILLDIKLPGMDGYEVLERTLKFDQGIVPIMITAFEDVEKVVRAMRMGAFDYITKPFDFNKVRLSIQKALEASQLKREVRHLRRTRRSWYGFENVVAISQEMKRVLQVAEKIAQSDKPRSWFKGRAGQERK